VVDGTLMHTLGLALYGVGVFDMDTDTLRMAFLAGEHESIFWHWDHLYYFHSVTRWLQRNCGVPSRFLLSLDAYCDMRDGLLVTTRSLETMLGICAGIHRDEVTIFGD
jgi:hypothetical protein